MQRNKGQLPNWPRSAALLSKYRAQRGKTQPPVVSSQTGTGFVVGCCSGSIMNSWDKSTSPSLKKTSLFKWRCSSTTSDPLMNSIRTLTILSLRKSPTLHPLIIHEHPSSRVNSWDPLWRGHGRGDGHGQHSHDVRNGHSSRGHPTI